MVAQELRFVQVESNVALIDSRVYCRDVIQVEHGAWMTNILKKHKSLIEELFGTIHFQNGTNYDANGKFNPNPELYCLLTEAQTNFALTLSRNTEKTMRVKAELIADFEQAKEMLRAQLERTLAAPVVDSEMFEILNQLEQEREEDAIVIREQLIRNEQLMLDMRTLEAKNKQLYDKMQFFQAKSMGQDMLGRLQNHPDNFSEDGELVWQISGIADKYYFNSRCEDDLQYGIDFIRERKKLKLTPYAALKMILNFRSKRGVATRYLPETAEVNLRDMTRPTTQGNKINRRAAQPQ